MSSVTSTSSVNNSPTNTPVNLDNEPPSAEGVRHLIENLNQPSSLQQSQDLVQRNITFNRADHSQMPNPHLAHFLDKPAQTPILPPNFEKLLRVFFYKNDLYLFTKDPENIEKLFANLSRTTQLESFERVYKRYLSRDWKFRSNVEEKVEYSIIAFLRNDITLEKLIEINTFTEKYAGIFIDKLGLQLQLPSGKVISLNYFLTDPLFRNVYPRDIKFAFVKLFLLINLPSFPEKYDNFFSNLNNKNWFEPYTSKPEELALLSLVAFLDGKIKREELFIMHLASAAFDAVKSESYLVTRAECEFVEADRIAEFLEKSGYPPFAANTQEHIISNNHRKQGAELEKEIETIVSKYSERSNVEKTFVKYTLKNFHHSNEKIGTIEMSIYYQTNTRIGFENVVDNETGTVILGPPEFIIELYRSASSISTPPASAQAFMFGFSPDSDALDALDAGVRPISLASFLFGLQLVHEFPTGLPLGTTKHDLDYHVPIDCINSHIDIFTEIARRIKTHAEKLHRASIDFKTCKAFEDFFIDREAVSYRYENDQRLAFWSFITFTLKKFKNHFQDPTFLKLFEDVIYPIILEVVSKSDKNIYIPTLEQAKGAIQNYKE